VETHAAQPSVKLLTFSPKKLKQTPVECTLGLSTIDYIRRGSGWSQCLRESTSYSYSRQGDKKRIEQTDRRNGRISILEVWQPDKASSDHWLVAVSTVKVIKVIPVHCQSLRPPKLSGQQDG